MLCCRVVHRVGEAVNWRALIGANNCLLRSASYSSKKFTCEIKVQVIVQIVVHPLNYGITTTQNLSLYTPIPDRVGIAQ